MSNTYLSFIVCDELFAVNVTKVLEVLQNEHITHVPNAPDYIKGIINFRGDVVPVFESRAKFNLSERPKNQSFVIIVLDLSSDNEVFRIGAIVDKVKDVISINDDEIKPVPAMGKEFNSEFLQGIFKLKDGFILMLDVEEVFNHDERKAIKDVQATEDNKVS
jgi:purine-binding chemotaxis protein CheW